MPEGGVVYMDQPRFNIALALLSHRPPLYTSFSVRFDVLAQARVPRATLLRAQAKAGGSVSRAIREALALYTADVVQPASSGPPPSDRRAPEPGVVQTPPVSGPTDDSIDALVDELLR